MSRSFLVTRKNFKGLTKEELIKQFNDPESDLSEWADKSQHKKNVIKGREIMAFVEKNKK